MPSVRSLFVTAKSRSRRRGLNPSIAPIAVQLMDDHVRLCLGDGTRDRVGVERVGHHRTGAEIAQDVLLRLAACHADDLVAASHELRDQWAAEGPCCACYEDLHDCSFLLVHPLDETGSRGCDSWVLGYLRGMPPRGVKKGTKRARQYEKIKKSQKAQGRSEDRAEEIAARTVNKEKARSGESRTRSRSSTRDISSGRRGGQRSGSTGPKGRTRDQLYNEAKKLGIDGRSPMNKSQLQRAVDGKKS